MLKQDHLLVALSLSLFTAACGAPEALNQVGTCSPAPIPAHSPAAYGRQALDKALAAAGITATVRVEIAGDGCADPVLAAARTALGEAPESFAIVADGNDTMVVGRDATGAMYGAMELAERVAAGEALPPASPITGSPDQVIRAGNLFLTLPQPGETDWWFYDESFWLDYLDLLARARFNVLDLHGMYAIESTLCPNALLYFANSTSFPDVGVPQADRDRNVAMLRKIVAMAAARGLKVGFMTYKTNLSIDAVTPGPSLTDDQVGRYTREAAADLARNVPDLWRLGFRVWESTHSPDWYVNTFIAGVHDAGTDIGIYSRSWGTSKPGMIDIANAANGDLVVEVKFNGDHIGPPYVITGGMVSGTGWWNYSYADYLNPPAPFVFVSEIWSLATHRILRHASFERIRRTVAGAKLGASQGISLGAPHGFMPVRDDYHAAEADRFSPWAFARDELQYLMFGRLAYDPSTPESVFRTLLAERAGTDELWPSLQAASNIVPWIQTMHTCGPDQRHFAPDMEWGGPVGYWASPPLAQYTGSPCDTGFHGPLDILSYAGSFEVAEGLVSGRRTSKLTPQEVARWVLHDVALARAAADAPIDPGNPLARDLARECVALADFGEYFAHKLRAATALAIYGQSGAQDYLDAARAETKTADLAWQQLAADTAYIAPVLETMRMKMLGPERYHWSMQVPHLSQDPASIDAFVAKVSKRPAAVPLPPVSTFLDTPRPPGPGLVSLDVHASDGGKQLVDVRFAHPLPQGALIHVLWKEFSGFADWHQAYAARDATDAQLYHARLPKADKSGFFAVEVLGQGTGWRYPDVLEGAPYVSVAP
jgi:hypothetical protein